MSPPSPRPRLEAPPLHPGFCRNEWQRCRRAAVSADWPLGAVTRRRPREHANGRSRRGVEPGLGAGHGYPGAEKPGGGRRRGRLSGLPPAPSRPLIALALSRPPVWLTPALPCRAVRRAPGRPPEQPKPMRAVRPAACADETELPARETERRINAVQESIPAVRGMEPPRRRPCREPVPDSTFSRLLTWIHSPHPPIPRLGRGPAPTGFPALLSLGDPLPRRTRISCLTRPPFPRILQTSNFQTLDPPAFPPPRGIPLLTWLHPPDPHSGGALTCSEASNPSRRRLPRVLRP